MCSRLENTEMFTLYQYIYNSKVTSLKIFCFLAIRVRHSTSSIHIPYIPNPLYS